MAGSSARQKLSAISCQLSAFRRFVLLLALTAIWLSAQIPVTPARSRLMRPLVRGTHAAVSSMKPEATLAAQRILDAGGNAFDAAVAGQAVLALVDAANN